MPLLRIRAALVAVLLCLAAASAAQAATLDPDLYVPDPSAAPQPAVRGQDITLTVQLSNIAVIDVGDTADATNVRLTAGSLPNGATVASVTATVGTATCTTSPARCTWAVLHPAETASDYVEMQLVLHTSGSTPLDATLAFTATSDQADQVVDDNTGTAIFSLLAPGATHLTLDGSGTPTTVDRGDTVTYDLVVANVGTNATDDAVVALTGPDGGAISSASWGDPATPCPRSGADMSCAIGPLLQGETETVHVVLDTSTIVSADAFTATFVAKSASRPDTVNDNGDPTTLVLENSFTPPLAAFVLSGSAAAETVGTGMAATVVGATLPLTYTITVTNPNATPQTLDALTLDLPAGFTADTISDSGTPQVVGATTTVSWASLAVPASATRNLTVRAVAPSSAGAVQAHVEGTAASTLAPDPQDVAPVTVLAIPTVSVGDATVAEGAEGHVPFTLSGVWVEPIEVAFATQAGTATETADFIGRTGQNATVTIASNATSAAADVTTVQDALDEENENLVVVAGTVIAGHATVGDGSGVLTITDDDAPPALAIGDATVAEGDAGTVDALVTVRLLAGGQPTESGRTVTVTVGTVAGTASSGVDYDPITSHEITFDPGEESKTVHVVVRGDTVDEADETVFLQVAGTPTNATVADATGIVTITDDDVAVPKRKPIGITASASPKSVRRGGNVTYAIRLRNPNGEAVQVTKLAICLPKGFAFVAGSTKGAIRRKPSLERCGMGRRLLVWRGAKLLLLAADKNGVVRVRAHAGRRTGRFAITVTGTAALPWKVRASGPVAPVKVVR